MKVNVFDFEGKPLAEIEAELKGDSLVIKTDSEFCTEEILQLGNQVIVDGKRKFLYLPRVWESNQVTCTLVSKEVNA